MRRGKKLVAELATQPAKPRKQLVFYTRAPLIFRQAPRTRLCFSSGQGAPIKFPGRSNRDCPASPKAAAIRFSVTTILDTTKFYTESLPEFRLRVALIRLAVNSSVGPCQRKIEMSGFLPY